MAAVIELLDSLFGAVAAGTGAVTSSAANAPKKLVETEKSATMSTYRRLRLFRVELQAISLNIAC